MSKTINFKCSEEYKKEIEARAKDLGYTVSVYIKMLINSDLKKGE